MLEFINNVKGPIQTVPESFRTTCYCMLELQLLEKLSDEGMGGWFQLRLRISQADHLFYTFPTLINYANCMRKPEIQVRISFRGWYIDCILRTKLSHIVSGKEKQNIPSLVNFVDASVVDFMKPRSTTEIITITFP